MQSAMYNCESWLAGNIVSKLYKKADFSSQNISRILEILGDESNQRQFFYSYLKQTGITKKSIIIDATSLPNEINSGFNNWGRADGSIEKQFRLLCVLDQETKLPIFYRHLPGNITDITTLQATIAEINKMGVSSSFVLLDAGYFSENNIKDLYTNKIDFMSRMPASRVIYKDLIGKKDQNLENVKNAVKFGHRGLFIKEEKIDLYGHEAYAYLVQDPMRKGKEINKLLLDHFAKEDASNIDEVEFNSCGVMILVSSKSMAPKDAIDCYYSRQSVEQAFGYYKSDLCSLPIRRHNDDTIRGYLFLQFLALIFFITLRKQLLDHYTVEQALLHLRNLKCKLFDNEIIIAEHTKKHKHIFQLTNIIMPNFLGI